MKIKLLMVGKTEDNWVQTGISLYEKRVLRYAQLEVIAIPYLKDKTSGQEEQKLKEGKQLLEKINPSDTVLLLDEKGSAYSSRKFAELINKQMLSGVKNVVFVIGGAYGFSQEMYFRANGKISFSSLTFPHQLIRIIFLEQLYRAFSILKNEPYHHD